MPADAPQFLTGLAQDVNEHGDCKSCRANAAMGLAALGLLEDFLGRSGLPDPRPPEVPFDLPHRDPSPPQPADPEALYQFRLILSGRAVVAAIVVAIGFAGCSSDEGQPVTGPRFDFIDACLEKPAPQPIEMGVVEAASHDDAPGRGVVVWLKCL